jgi:hypothetical protein
LVVAMKHRAENPPARLLAVVLLEVMDQRIG